VSALLVTGTGIRVGKTRVAGALARMLTAAGRRVVAIKPVETGCGNATAAEEDGARLAAATGQAAPREALFRFTAPLVPALAAEREDAAIDLDALVLRIEELRADADVLLLEGAGGLLSPIAW
jgi:dethiobiotin synthetase